METVKIDVRNDRPPSPLAGRGRLAALRRCRLLDTEPEEAFDRVTRLAARFLSAPVALVSLVEAHRQFLKSSFGLSDSEASTRNGPIAHSFCQHVVTLETSLVVNDARKHPLVRDSAAVPNILAYLGVPLRAPTGEVLGALCVYDHEPRAWSAEDEQALQDLAAVLTDELERRETARQHEEDVRAHDTISALTEASFDTIADIFFVLDPEGHLLRWNERLSTVTGHADQDLAGMHALAFFPEDHRTAVAKAIARVYDEGRAVLEADFLTKKGRVPYELNGMPLHDGDGRVIGLCGKGRDLTERKEAEAALRESEERYRSLFTLMDQGYCVFEMVPDGDGTFVDYRFLETNPAFEEETGLVDAVGRTARDLVPDIEDHWVETYGRVVRTGEPVRFEQGSAAMGRWFDVFASRVGGAGSRRVALLFSDITERKCADEALHASERTLRESKARFDGVLASIPGLTFQAHFTSEGALTFPYVSNVGPNVLGRQLSLLLRAHPERLQDLIHPDDQEGLLRSTAEVARAAEQGAPLDSWSWEGRVVVGKGIVRWVSVGALPVTDEAGRILWNGVALDVTDRHEAQQNAAAAAQRTSEILASISDAFFAVDRDWDFTYANEQAAQLWGRPNAEVLGQNVWEMFPELAETEFGEAYCRAAETGETLSVTSWYAPLEKHIEVRIYPFAEGLSVYFRDVSTEVEQEAAVQESEARFRQMAEAMPQIVWTTRPDGYHDYFNERWYAFTGMPRPDETGGEGEAPQGFNWKDYLHPDDYERTVAHWKHSLVSGEPYDVEYRFKRASDGAYRWFIARAEPVHDASGAIVRWFGTCTDIHDSHEAETALRQSEERLRLVNRATRDAIWDLDLTAPEASSQMISWSPAMRDEFGWADALEGTNFAWWEKRVHPEEKDRVVMSLQRAIDGGEDEWQEEYRFARSDGTWVDVLDRGYVVWNADGKLIRMVGSMLNITAQKETERSLIVAKEQAEVARAEAEAMARTKSALLSNMSHEIRTPLTSVIGFADLLADEASEVHRDFALLIAQGGRRLMDTLNSVLDLAQIEASSHRLHLVEADVGAVVSNVADLLRAQAESKGVSLNVVIPAELPLIRTDVAALFRVVTNLVSNAVKFTEVGSVSVSVRANGEGVEVSVVDTGVGIAEAFLPHLFQGFRQESEGENRHFEGSGLGLTITKRLVEMLSGEIEVESAKGVGSTFTVRLPVGEPC